MDGTGDAEAGDGFAAGVENGSAEAGGLEGDLFGFYGVALAANFREFGAEGGFARDGFFGEGGERTADDEAIDDGGEGERENGASEGGGVDGDGGAGAFGEAEGGFGGDDFEVDDFILLEFAEVDCFAEGVAEANHVRKGGAAEGFEIFAGGEEAGDAIAETVRFLGFVTDEDAEVLEGAEDAEDRGFGYAGANYGFAEGDGAGAGDLFEKAEGALEDRD